MAISCCTREKNAQQKMLYGQQTLKIKDLDLTNLECKRMEISFSMMLLINPYGPLKLIIKEPVVISLSFKMMGISLFTMAIRKLFGLAALIYD